MPVTGLPTLISAITKARVSADLNVILSVDAIRYPLTGIGRYTLELARQLQSLPDIETLRFFSGLSFIDALPVPGAAPPGVGASRIRALKSFLARSDAALSLHQLLSHWRRGRALSKHSDAIFHGTNFYLPPHPGRSVVTMHDLSVYTFPQFHPPERVRYMHREIELTLKRADILITDSEFTRQEVAAFFGWPLSRVYCAPLASSGEFVPHSAAELRPTLAPLGLHYQGYALYAGTIEPRKNLENLLKAYGRLSAALRVQYPLVLVGYKGWQNASIMERLAAAESEGWARYLGYVEAEQLPQLFAGARAFVFPSHYEGFGLPVLEAMSAGVAVVTSTRSSLPEVAAEAAALCEPDDIEGLTAAFGRALEDEEWRSTAIAAGLARSKLFSWQRCAEATVKAYRAA